MSDQNKQFEETEHAGVMENISEGFNFLMLHNDEVNSFDYIIESLIDVCEHDEFQAEQCAYIAHYKGKCDVKKGSFDSLHSLHKELGKRGITTTID